MYGTFDEYHEKVYDEILSKCKTARKYLLDKGDHPAMLTHFDSFYDLSMKFLTKD